MKKVFVVLSLVSLLLLSSCDDVKGVLELLPKFDSNLPNNISGSYAYFDSEEAKDRGEYTRLFTFDSKENTYTFTFSTDEGVIKDSGKYSVRYTTYKITECNGVISLENQDKEKRDISFYWYSSALSGPEYLMLDDGRTYLYW